MTANSGAGGAWTPEHGILFARGQDNVFRVSDRGGDPTVYVAADTSREGDLHEPNVLPDGGLLVVPHLSGSNGLETLEIVYGSERVQVTHTPGNRIYRPVWSPTGHILYERRTGNTGVWAVPWDLSGRRASGESFLVFPRGVYPSVANDGTLVLLQGLASGRMQVVEADRTGKVLRKIGDPRRYQFSLALAPDGNRLAVIHDDEGTQDVWINDLARGTESRLTFFRGSKTHPQWSPDGRYLSYYVGNSVSTIQAVIQATDGSAGFDTLAARGAGASFVPGTNDMVFSIYDGDNEWDLFTGPAVAGGERRPLVTETSWQYAAVVSPDGNYVAYVSRETGVDQVFLKRYPDGSGKWQVSIESGQWPQWTTAGDRLVYVRGDDIVEVAIETSNPPVLGRPELLFTRPGLGYQIGFGWNPHFTMTGDGQRFYFYQPAEDGGLRTTMVLYDNWTRAFDTE
jgi:Tol biopolymer transport system component